MAINDLILSKSEQKGVLRNFDTSRIYFAEVMDTRDPTHSGKIKVWIISSDIDKNDIEKWVIATPASNFYGTTPIRNDMSGQSPISYGMINKIPYPGTVVAIFYPPVLGENTMPFWFACPVDDYMNKSCPSFPGTDSNPPKYEVNPTKENDSPEFINPLVKGINAQGLNKDKLRGYSRASATRTDFPTSYGFSSPLGNSISIDDGVSLLDPQGDWDSAPDKFNMIVKDKDNKELPHEHVDWESDVRNPTKNTRYYGGMRFRTRNGTQILISDNGPIYMINRDGSAWVELSDDGYIDCFSDKGVNVNSTGDINISTASNLNIEVGGKINIKADDITAETSKVGLSTAELDVSGTIKAPSVHGNTIVASNLYSNNAQLSGVYQGTLKGTSELSLATLVIGGTTLAPQEKQCESASVRPLNSNTIFGRNGMKQSGTILTRKPTHEPYDGHNLNDLLPVEKETKDNG